MADPNVTVDAGSDAAAFAFGSAYFGATQIVGPTVLSSNGFYLRAISESKGTPEVFATATNGDGQVEQVALSTAGNRMRAEQFVGYIDPTVFSIDTIPTNFIWTPPASSVSRKYFVKEISSPYPKGQFVEVTISVESYPLVQT